MGDGAENFGRTIDEPSWQNINLLNTSEHSSDLTMPIDSQTEIPVATKKVPQKNYNKMPSFNSKGQKSSFTRPKQKSTKTTRASFKGSNIDQQSNTSIP